MESPPAPVFRRSFPLLTRLRYFTKIYFVKLLLSIILRIAQLPGIRDKKLAPTLIKTDQAHPSYRVRVFIPKSYEHGGPLLPLYIDIHGGGFAIANPSGDDKFCAPLAEKNGIVVVSLDYPKSPWYAYPTAVRSLIESVKGILRDESIPFDKSKVALGGFSAGANLSLAICQDEALQGRIGGIVAFYPPCDWTISVTEKLASRPRAAPQDVLEHSADMFNWGYLKQDQDLRDRQLSVTFAPRKLLPPKICIFGCEYDMLCREAEVMAQQWGSIGDGQRKGNDLVWEQNGIRWEKVLGVNHSFDMSPAYGEEKPRLEKRAIEMWDSAAQWLFREVYI